MNIIRIHSPLLLLPKVLPNRLLREINESLDVGERVVEGSGGNADYARTPEIALEIKSYQMSPRNISDNNRIRSDIYPGI